MNSSAPTNYRRALSAAAAFAALFVIPLTNFGQNRTTVRVSPNNVVESERVDLGSIAEIAGLADSKRLSAISLGYAPNIGAARQITCGQIALAIRAAGFNESDLKIDCPGPAVIRRNGQPVSEDLIRTAIESSVSEVLPKEQVDARFLRLDIPPGLQAPVGKLDIGINWSGIRNIFTPFSLPIEIRVDGKLFRTIAVAAEIEATAKVLIAARDLAANTEVSENDVRPERVRLDRPLSGYVRTQIEIVGTMITRETRAGTPFTTDMVAKVAVVKAGDPVRIEGYSGRMKLVIIGEAKAAGRIGDRIAVRNIQSGAILQAVVAGKGVVTIGL